MPDGLDDRARFNAWHDMYVAAYCEFDLKRIDGKPFSATTEVQQVGAIGVAGTAAGVDRLVRNKQQVASAVRSNFCLAFSRSESPFIQAQLGRETVHRPENPILV